MGEFLQLQNTLLNDIYTFVLHNGMEYFDSIESFSDHRNDIRKLQFWTFKIISSKNSSDFEKKYLC